MFSSYQALTAASGVGYPAARFSPYGPPECLNTQVTLTPCAKFAIVLSYVSGGAPWRARYWLCASRTALSKELSVGGETAADVVGVGVGVGVVAGGGVGVVAGGGGGVVVVGMVAGFTGGGGVVSTGVVVGGVVSAGGGGVGCSGAGAVGGEVCVFDLCPCCHSG